MKKFCQISEGRFFNSNVGTKYQLNNIKSSVMFNKSNLFFINIILLIFFVHGVNAQTYEIDTVDGQIITTCVGTFLDSGGSSGSYKNHENYTTTLKSDNGQPLNVNFTEWQVESNGSCTLDGLRIYDGANNSAPLLGTFCNTSPGIITSTNGFNALHFEFFSNDSVVKSGWSANISCATIGSCNTLWYGGDQSFGFEGTVGTLALNGQSSAVFNIDAQTGNTGNLQGTAAMAIDPSNPTLIYYVPRDAGFSGPYGGLWVYNTVTDTSTELTSAADTANVVRLGIDPNGLVWTVNSSGTAFSYDPVSNLWTNRGTVILPSPFLWSDLGSGDLTFDGNGTMYLIASNSSGTTGELFTITQQELLDGTPESFYVGQMGTSQFNGIAFTEDGLLWATSINTSTNESFLYSVDISTGVASSPITISGTETSDLSSCALPIPDVVVVKSVSATGTVSVGDVITYTINVCNLGSLTATNVFLEDALPAGASYVQNSTTVNGSSIPDQGANSPFLTRRRVNSPGAQGGRIAPGDCAIIEFDMVIDSNVGEICNQAIVSYTGSNGNVLSDDPTESGDTDQTCVSFDPGVLAITKSSSPSESVTQGETVNYTIAVENIGSTLINNVILDDILPEGVTYISNSAEKTYWINTTTPGGTETGTFTYNYDPGCTGVTNPLVQSFTVTSADVPANAILTSYAYNVSVSTADQLDHLSLIGTYPDGTAFSVPQGYFGGTDSGTSVKNGTGTVDGSALGTYQLSWTDAVNGPNISQCSADNYVDSASFTIGYSYTLPDTVTRTQVTDAANPPLNMVIATDEITLLPGEIMTVTYSVQVDENTTGTLTNIATANGDLVDPADTENVLCVQLDAGSSNNIQVCQGEFSLQNFFTTLGGNPDTGGVWADVNGSGVVLGNGMSVDISNVISGTYNFTYSFETIGNCQGVSATITLLIDPLPVCNAVNNGPICDGDILLLDELGGNAISWSWISNGSATISNANIKNPTASGASNGEIFTVIITDINGCVSSCSSIAVVNEIPMAPVVSVINNCDGTSTLTASEFTGDLLWSTGESTTSINVNIAGTYTLTQTINGCESAIAQETATPNNNPIVDEPANVVACDSYELPVLTIGDYYENSNGVGLISQGTILTTSQTIYVYAETGTQPNCSDEHIFTVTINETPNVDKPLDVAVCGSYELPTLTSGNYFGSANGIDPVAEGTVITSTQTIFIYAATGTDPNCFDEHSFMVTVDTCDLKIQKEGSFNDENGDTFGEVGETITFTYTITNEGTVPLSNITLVENVADFSGVGILPNPVYQNGDTNTNDLLDLTETWTYSANYILEELDVEAGVVYNLASTSGTPPTGNPVVDSSDDPTPIDVTDPNFDPECPDCTVTLVPINPCLDLTLWVFLEGSLVEPQTGTYNAPPMRTTLNDSRLLPGQLSENPFSGNIYTPALGANGQVFNIGPWNYLGTEGSKYNSAGSTANADADYPLTVTDWVLVSLRTNPSDGSEALCQRAGLLHSDGHIEFMDDADCCDLDDSQSYYIVIEHRNHLVIMSATAVAPVDGSIVYDFRNKESFINDPFNSGNFIGQKEVLPGVFAMYGGNGDQTSVNSEDTDITSSDFSKWLNNGPQNRTYNLIDYNMDGDVSALDYNLWQFNSPRFTSVPRN